MNEMVWMRRTWAQESATRTGGVCGLRDLDIEGVNGKRVKGG